MGRHLHSLTAIRRLRACLLLPLLLILSQHGAWLHELSHAVYAAGSHQVTYQQAPDSSENGICATCQSFGQLGSALGGTFAASAPPTLHRCPQTQPQYSSPAAQRPAPRNRGPPQLV